MTITLDETMTEELRENALRVGAKDAHSYAVFLLRDALTQKSEQAQDTITPEELAEIKKELAPAIADEEAGRFSTLDEAIAETRSSYNLPETWPYSQSK